MTKTKKHLYSTLVLVAIAFWGYNNLSQKEPAVAPAPVAATTAGQLTTTTAPIHPNNSALNAVREKQWASDPFYRQHVNQQAPQQNILTTSFKLKAIIYNETSPSAYLNNRVVRKGDVVNGAKVSNITKRAVILQKDGREIIVTVKRG